MGQGLKILCKARNGFDIPPDTVNLPGITITDSAFLSDDYRRRMKAYRDSLNLHNLTNSFDKAYNDFRQTDSLRAAAHDEVNKINILIKKKKARHLDREWYTVRSDWEEAEAMSPKYQEYLFEYDKAQEKFVRKVMPYIRMPKDKNWGSFVKIKSVEKGDERILRDPKIDPSKEIKPVRYLQRFYGSDIPGYIPYYEKPTKPSPRYRPPKRMESIDPNKKGNPKISEKDNEFKVSVGGHEIYFHYSPGGRNNYINWGEGQGIEPLTNKQAEALYKEWNDTGVLKMLGNTGQSNVTGRAKFKEGGEVKKKKGRNLHVIAEAPIRYNYDKVINELLKIHYPDEFKNFDFEKYMNDEQKKFLERDAVEDSIREAVGDRWGDEQWDEYARRVGEIDEKYDTEESKFYNRYRSKIGRHTFNDFLEKEGGERGLKNYPDIFYRADEFIQESEKLKNNPFVRSAYDTVFITPTHKNPAVIDSIGQSFNKGDDLVMMGHRGGDLLGIPVDDLNLTEFWGKPGLCILGSCEGGGSTRNPTLNTNALKIAHKLDAPVYGTSGKHKWWGVNPKGKDMLETFFTVTRDSISPKPVNYKRYSLPFKQTKYYDNYVPYPARDRLQDGGDILPADKTRRSRTLIPYGGRLNIGYTPPEYVPTNQGYIGLSSRDITNPNAMLPQLHLTSGEYTDTYDNAFVALASLANVPKTVVQGAKAIPKIVKGLKGKGINFNSADEWEGVMDVVNDWAKKKPIEYKTTPKPYLADEPSTVYGNKHTKAIKEFMENKYKDQPKKMNELVNETIQRFNFEANNPHIDEAIKEMDLAKSANEYLRNLPKAKKQKFRTYFAKLKDYQNRADEFATTIAEKKYPGLFDVDVDEMSEEGFKYYKNVLALYDEIAASGKKGFVPRPEKPEGIETFWDAEDIWLDMFQRYPFQQPLTEGNPYLGFFHRGKEVKYNPNNHFFRDLPDRTMEGLDVPRMSQDINKILRNIGEISDGVPLNPETPYSPEFIDYIELMKNKNARPFMKKGGVVYPTKLKKEGVLKIVPIHGPSHKEGGVPMVLNGLPVEAEGGEFLLDMKDGSKIVLNKKQMKKINMGEALSKVRKSLPKFKAEGGVDIDPQIDRYRKDYPEMFYDDGRINTYLYSQWKNPSNPRGYFRNRFPINVYPNMNKRFEKDYRYVDQSMFPSANPLFARTVGQPNGALAILPTPPKEVNIVAKNGRTDHPMLRSQGVSGGSQGISSINPQERVGDFDLFGGINVGDLAFDISMGEEGYADDIPFNTERIAQMNTPFSLPAEENVDDIPFNTEHNAFMAQMPKLDQEGNVNDIPWNTLKTLANKPQSKSTNMENPFDTSIIDSFVNEYQKNLGKAYKTGQIPLAAQLISSLGALGSNANQYYKDRVSPITFSPQPTQKVSSASAIEEINKTFNNAIEMARKTGKPEMITSLVAQKNEAIRKATSDANKLNAQIIAAADRSNAGLRYRTDAINAQIADRNLMRRDAFDQFKAQVDAENRSNISQLLSMYPNFAMEKNQNMLMSDIIGHLAKSGQLQSLMGLGS